MLLPTDDIILPKDCFQSGNVNTTVKKTGTFVQTSKHLRTQQLLAKATDHIKQILKHVRLPFS